MSLKHYSSHLINVICIIYIEYEIKMSLLTKFEIYRSITDFLFDWILTKSFNTFLCLCVFPSDSFGSHVRQKKPKRKFLEEFSRKGSTIQRADKEILTSRKHRIQFYVRGGGSVYRGWGGGVNTIDASLAATHTWAHLRPQCDTSAPRGCLATPQTSRPKLPVLWEPTYLHGGGF